MSTPVVTPANILAQHDEHILVVPREQLFPNGAWHGIRHTDFDTYISIINQHKMFMPRTLAEHDPRYKQIIPYLVFMYQDTIFIMQRRSDASETRLRNKHSIGIGGHIRQEDMESDSIFAWAKREFHEEVDYTGSIDITPFGILNDDSDAVGQVHMGLVLIIHGSSSTINIRSELKSGYLLPIDSCVMYKDSMESWSRYVLHELLGRQAWSIHTP